MCGNFGFSGKEGKKANIKKLEQLGLYNITRGIDSCGYWYNGNLVKGVNANAIWGNFIVNNKIKKGDLPCETFIGHVRKSTHGSNTEENAHPHLVGNYVQAHNGVIKNHWALAIENKINCNGITVDSIVLAHLIKEKGFEILKKYEGTAALCFTYVDDPTSLYLFHGASKKDKGGECYEERPLFILDQPEGIYYSSLEESLTFISSNGKKPHMLEHNKVFKIKNGIITDYEYIVDRENANLNPIHVFNNYVPQTNTIIRELPFNNTAYKNNIVDILYEKIPLEKSKQNIYFFKGRYFRGEHILLNGVYFIDRAGKMHDSLENNVNVLIETYYFIRGVMIKNEKAYNKCLNECPTINTNLAQNTAYFLSMYSQYPITCIEEEGIMIHDNIKKNWYKDGKLYTGCLNIKFGKRKYLLKNGELIRIISTEENDKICMGQSKVIMFYVLDNQNLFNLHNKLLNSKTTLMDDIIHEVSLWCEKPITENTDINLIPETFLIFIDAYNRTFYAVETADQIIESDTTAILKDLIKFNFTFHEYLQEQKNFTFAKINNVKNTFKDYVAEELIELENRYNFINFNEDEEITEKDLIFQEEIIQEKKNEDSQNVYNLYQALKNISAEYEETIKKLESYDMIEEAQTLTFKGSQILDLMQNTYKEVEKTIIPF